MIKNKLVESASSQDQSVIIFVKDDSQTQPLIMSIAKKLGVNKEDMVDFSYSEGVETLRAKIKHFHLKPNSSPKRLFVIYGVDLLNRAQANTLLKTLEEPPQLGKIILIAKNKTRVLSTILSRCHQLYHSSKIDNDRESIISIVNDLSFSDYSKKIKQLDRGGAVYLLQGGLEELRQKGLNKSKGQVFKQIGNSLILLESTNCNYKLVLERLYILIKSQQK